MSNLREMRNRRDLRGVPLEIISLYAQLKIGDSEKLTKNEILELNVEELCNKVKSVSLKRGSRKYIPILMKKICQIQNEKATLLLNDARRLCENLDKLSKQRQEHPGEFPPLMDVPPELDPNIPPPEDTINIGDELQNLIQEREAELALNTANPISLEHEPDGPENQPAVVVPENDLDFLPLGTSDIFYEDFEQLGIGDTQPDVGGSTEPQPWQDEAAALPIADEPQQQTSMRPSGAAVQTDTVFKSPLPPDVQQKSKRRKTPRRQIKVTRRKDVEPKCYTETEPEREIETLTVWRFDKNDYDFGEEIENLERLRAEKMKECPKMPKKKTKIPVVLVTSATPPRDTPSRNAEIPPANSPFHLSTGWTPAPYPPQEGAGTSDAQQDAPEEGAAALPAVIAAPSDRENVDTVEVRSTGSTRSTSSFTKTSKIELKISETVEKHNVGDFIKLQEMTHWPNSKEALKETFIVLMEMIENLPLVVEYEEGTLYFKGVRKVAN